MTKRGKNIDKIKIIIGTLVAGKPLDAIHKDHPLVVDSQRNVPVFSQRILPDTESGLNQYLKKQ